MIASPAIHHTWLRTAVERRTALESAMHAVGIVATSNAQIERVEKEWLTLPQVECPLRHFFSDGVYYREITMPAGVFVIGHEHKTKHLNVVTKGRASVMIDGVLREIRAGEVFESGVGVRKVLLIHEEMVWSTVHVTTERDLAKLEELLITKSESHQLHMKDIEALKHLKGGT
jgi:hypothetical protein